MQSTDEKGFVKNLRRLLDPLLVPLLAILTAVILGGLIIKVVGGDPIAAYKGLTQGAFGSPKALSETAVWATPYIFAGLAVAVAFSRVWSNFLDSSFRFMVPSSRSGQWRLQYFSVVTEAAPQERPVEIQAPNEKMQGRFV